MRPIRGRNLEGEEVIIPRDLRSDPAILLIAFKMWQQAAVDRWAEALEPLADRALAIYEVPLISRIWSPARGFIDGGMARSISDREVRLRTITVYDDVRAIMRDVGIRTTRRVAAVAVSPAGMIRAMTDAAPDSAAGQEFVSQVARLPADPAG